MPANRLFNQMLRISRAKVFLVEAVVEDDTIFITFVELRLTGLWRAAEIAAFSKEKRAQYDSDMITERDHENMMYSAEKRGRQEGKAEVAKAMLAAGMPLEQIVSLTGLTEEQVKGLD